MKFEIYEGTTLLSLSPSGEWRWRLKAKNGRIVADSGEAYSSERAVRRAIKRLDEYMSGTIAPIPVEVVEC